MSDEGAHAEFLGESQGFAVVALGVLGAVDRRDVPGQAAGVGLASSSPDPPGERQRLSSVLRWPHGGPPLTADYFL